MNELNLKFILSYSGHDSDSHKIDFYDVSQALVGFQRTLALTTYLVLNDEIITQAPALKGARIYALPAEEGSWKFTVYVTLFASGLYALTTLPNNTPLGHLVFSAYDYVVSESLGFHVDYNKSLGQLNEENKAAKIQLPEIREAQLDSLIEKCHTPIKEIHRPIYKTGTAETAKIMTELDDKKKTLKGEFSYDSYCYLTEDYLGESFENVEGSISSYNSNTFKGRIYVPKEERPISFILADIARTESFIKIIVQSLSSNALRRFERTDSTIYFKVINNRNRSGHLKSYNVYGVSDEPFDLDDGHEEYYE